jgi:YD repeat-containing protein
MSFLDRWPNRRAIRVTALFVALATGVTVPLLPRLGVSAAEAKPRSVPMLAAQGPAPTVAWPAGDFTAATRRAAAFATAAPTLLSPADGATVATARPVLRITPPAGATQYRFSIGADGSAEEGNVATSGWIGQAQWTVPAGVLTDGGHYTWSASARTGTADPGGPAAAARTFTVNLRLGQQQPGGPVPTDTTGPLTVNLSTGNVTTALYSTYVLTGTGPQAAQFSYNSLAAVGQGLRGAYYAGDSASGIAATEKPVLVRNEPQVSVFYSGKSKRPPGIEGTAFRVRWTGSIRVPATGVYRFGGLYLHGLRIQVDGKPVFDGWTKEPKDLSPVGYGSGTTLQAGHEYAIQVDYRAGSLPALAQLWVSTGDGRRQAPVPASWLTQPGGVLPPGWTVNPPPAAVPATLKAAALAPAAPKAGPATPAKPGWAPPNPLSRSRSGGSPSLPAAAAEPAAKSAGTARTLAAEQPSMQYHFAGSDRCADATAPAGYLCAVSLPNGSLTALSYVNGQLARITNPGNEITDFGYDGANLLNRVRPALVTDWIAVDPDRRASDAAAYLVKYDADGRALRVSAPEPAGLPRAVPQRPERSYTYGEDRTRVQVTGLDAGRPSRLITHDLAGRVLTDTDGTGATTKYTWTSGDQPLTKIDPAGRQTATVATATGSATNGPAPVRCFNADGTLIGTPPSGCERAPVQRTEFDGSALVTTTVESDGLPDKRVALGLNAVGLPASRTLDPGGLALTSTTAYDPYFRPASTSTPTGATSTYEYYGPAETVASPCDPAAAPVNQRGLLKSTSSAPGATSAARVDRYVYNDRGFEIAVNFGSDKWACGTYDARGRATGILVPGNAAGPERHSRYDYATGGDPLTMSVTDPTGSISTTTDLIGRTLSYTDVYGVVTRSTYDRAGRVVAKSVSGPGGAAPATVTTRGYDNAGHLLTVTYGGRSMAAAAYSAAGELRSVRYGNGTALSAVDRDPAGRVTGLTWALRDGKRVVSAVERSRAGTVVDDRLAGTDARPGAPNYRYDAAGRLIDAWVTGHHFGYDYTSASAPGCPAGTEPKAGADSNAVAVVDETAAGRAVTSYCFDRADRLLAASGAHTIGDVTYASSGHTSGYTVDQQHVSLGWDVAERVTSMAVTGPDPAQVTYGRNVLDQVVTRTVTGSGDEDSVTLLHVNPTDTTESLEMDRNRKVLSRTITLPGGVLATLSGAGEYWSHPNVHGDVALGTDASGKQSGDLFRYTPYGAPVTADGRIATDHQPPNQPAGQEFGWLGQYRRHHEGAGSLSVVLMALTPVDQLTGRALAMSQVGNPTGATYQYAQGDPINLADLNGFQPQPNVPDLGGLPPYLGGAG